ncbi:hypothetical protein AB0E85_37770 [Streptomyces sp. NPDC029044]|uniref:hypothetical protein n=1 Tax=Streptomyces sp. NPDC029044 TaxID=3157198 RepID=UPI0033E2B39F
MCRTLCWPGFGSSQDCRVLLVALLDGLLVGADGGGIAVPLNVCEKHGAGCAGFAGEYAKGAPRSGKRVEVGAGHLVRGRQVRLHQLDARGQLLQGPAGVGDVSAGFGVQVLEVAADFVGLVVGVAHRAADAAEFVFEVVDVAEACLQ